MRGARSPLPIPVPAIPLTAPPLPVSNLPPKSRRSWRSEKLENEPGGTATQDETKDSRGRIAAATNVVAPVPHVVAPVPHVMAPVPHVMAPVPDVMALVPGWRRPMRRFPM